MHHFKSIDNLDTLSIYLRGDSILSDGSAEQPALRFATDSRTGLYNLNRGVGISVDEVPTADFGLDTIVAFKPLRVVDGTTSNVGIGFRNTHGLAYDSALDEIDIVHSATKRIKLTPSQTIVEGPTSITGDTVVNGTLTTNSSFLIGGNITTTNDYIVGGQLSVASLVCSGLATFQASLIISNMQNTNALNDGPFVSLGGGSIAKDFYVGGTTNLLSDVFVLQNLTTFESSVSSLADAVSQGTGALIVQGGASVNKTLRVGTDLVVTNSASLYTLVVGSNASLDGNTTFNGASDFIGPATFDTCTTNGVLFVNDVTDTLSSTTGALRVAGGVAIGKKVRVADNAIIEGSLLCNSSATFDTLTANGIVSILDETEATVLGQGSFVTYGGVSVAKNLVVGGHIDVDGPLQIGSLVLDSLIIDLNAPLGSVLTPVIASIIFDAASTVGIIWTDRQNDGVSDLTIGVNTNTNFVRIGDDGLLTCENLSSQFLTRDTTGGKTRAFAISHDDTILGVQDLLRADTITKTIYLEIPTQSANTTTGALVISGGLGITGNTNATLLSLTSKLRLNNGQQIQFNGADITWQLGLNAVTGSIIGETLTGNCLIAKVFNGANQGFQIVNNSTEALFEVAGSLTDTTGVSVHHTTTSTSSTSGAFVVAGGAGFGENVHIGGDLNVSGLAEVTSNFTVSGDTQLSNVSASGNVDVDGTLTVIGTAAMGSVNATALDISGSLDVGQNATVLGSVIAGTEDPVTLTTRSLDFNAPGGTNASPKLSFIRFDSANNAYIRWYDRNADSGLSLMSFYVNSQSRLDLYNNRSAVFQDFNTLFVTSDSVTGQSPNAFRITHNDAINGGENIFRVNTQTKNVLLEKFVGSISTTSGALVVTGGVGVGENLNVGGNLNVYGTGDIDAVPSFTILGGAAISKRLLVSSTENATVTSDTGAFQCAGGLRAAGTVFITNTEDVTAPNPSFVTLGGALIGKALNVNATLAIGSSADIDASVPAFRLLSGGAVIQKRLAVNSVEGGTALGAGAIQCSGGIYAAGTVAFGDNTDIAGTLTVNGDTQLATLSTSGLATLSSAYIVNGCTVTGDTQLTTLSTSSLATVNSLAVNGTSNFATLTTSGLATLESLVVANAAQFSTFSATGLGTLHSLVVTTTAQLSTLATTGLATLQSIAVTGTSQLSTLSTSGLSTLQSLIVTGTSQLSTLTTSGLATLNSASVTNTLTAATATVTNATVDTLGVVLNTTLAGNLVVQGTGTFLDPVTVTDTASLQGTTNVTGLFKTPHRIIAATTGASYDLATPPATVLSFSSSFTTETFNFTLPFASTQSTFTLLYNVQSGVRLNFLAQTGDTILGRDFLGPTAAAQTGVIKYVSDGTDEWFFFHTLNH